MDETVLHGSQPPEEKHLNPLAFPAETDVRFNLLIVAVIMLALNTTVVVLAGFEGGAGSPLDNTRLSEAITVFQDEASTPDEDLAAAAGIAAFGIVRIGLFGFFLGVVLGLAALIYRGHPGRIRRSHKLKPLSPDKDPKLIAELSTLAATAGVTPQVEIGEPGGPADGQAFGFRGKYVIRLGGGMPLLLRKAPAMFRATVLHELAHVANGDVPRAYFTQSLWLALVVVLIVPLGLIYGVLYISNGVGKLAELVRGEGPDLLRFFTYSTPAFAYNILQLAGLLALYATIRGSLLRAREIYADWRSALWGSAKGLTAIFERGAQIKERGWFRLWRLHPSPGERLRLLRDPHRLFAIPGDIPLLVGALLGASASGSMLAIGLIALGLGGALELVSIAVSQLPGTIAILLALGLTLLTVVLTLAIVIAPQLWLASAAAGSLGLEAQKDAVAAVAYKEKAGLRRALGLLRPAALFAVGLEFGLLIAPAGFFVDVLGLFGYEGSLIVPFVVIPGLSLLWVACVTGLVWLWLLWASHTAQRLLGAHTGAKVPDSRRKFLAAWLTLILWLILMPALLVENEIWTFVTASRNLVSGSSLLIVILVTAALVAAAAAVGWLIVELRRGGAITCPACGQKTKQRHAVGRQCEHCGAELAPWIFINSRPAT